MGISENGSSCYSQIRGGYAFQTTPVLVFVLGLSFI